MGSPISRIVAAPLTKRFRELVQRGDVSREYRSRLSYVRAVVLACVNAGMTEDEAWEFLTRSGHESAWYLLRDDDRRPRRRARKWFVHVWATQSAYAARSPAFQNRGEVLARIEEIAEAVEAAAWDGTGTDLAVILAILAKARRVGKIRIVAAVRDVSVWANIGYDTASKSLKRLSAGDGWLRRSARYSSTEAAESRSGSRSGDRNRTHPIVVVPR